jgi:hypothetical protein
MKWEVRVMRRHVVQAEAFLICARLCVWVGLLAGAGAARGVDNIFDDNWTPPKRVEKAPANPPAARPGVTPAPKPSPTPENPPATKVEPTRTTPAETPGDTAASGRRAVPAKAEQDRSRKLLKDVFAAQLADRSPAARRKLAQALMAEASKTSDNPVDQFVLLAAAVKAGREAGSIALSFEAADEMAKSFDVDGLALRTETALKTPLTSAPPDAAAENLRAGMELLDELVAAEDFVSAARLTSILQRAAANAPLQRGVLQQRLKEVAELRLAHDRFLLQREKLKTSPDDPVANLAVGGYYAYVKNQWDVALPYLAKGNNALVKRAIAAEEAHPKTPDQLIATGDAWWDAGEKEAASAPGRGAMRRRAASFYGKALEGAEVTGLNRTRLEKRLELAGAGESMGGVTRPQSVLLFRGGGKAEEESFKAIADGRVRIVQGAETTAALADPGTYTNYTMIVIGTNRWRGLSPDLVTEQARHSLQEFVRGGGDLIFFEQFAMTNMSIIDNLFGFKTGGGPTGAIVENAELKARLDEAGYNDVMLESVQFYNSYLQLPEDAHVLLRSGKNRVPTGVVIPFGRGRLIMIGTTWDKLEEKLNEAFLQVIYRPSPSKP